MSGIQVSGSRLGELEGFREVNKQMVPHMYDALLRLMRMRVMVRRMMMMMMMMMRMRMITNVMMIMIMTVW